MILRLHEADINDHDLYEPVRLYLKKHGHPASEIKANRHFIHIQPPNPHIPQADPKIHIIIDMETVQFSGQIDCDFLMNFTESIVNELNCTERP